MKLARIAQLRPPTWNSVKRQWDVNKTTSYGKVFTIITGVTALGMAAAFIFPANAVVQFLGGYSLACFVPALNLLQLRKWNRTLAFPAALIYAAVAVFTLLACFSFGTVLTALILSLSFVFAATSDRLSFIFKWNPPFDHLGTVGAALLLCLVIFFIPTFFVFAIFISIFIIVLFIVIRGIFGRRRYRRRYRRWF